MGMIRKCVSSTAVSTRRGGIPTAPKMQAQGFLAKELRIVSGPICLRVPEPKRVARTGTVFRTGITQMEVSSIGHGVSFKDSFNLEVRGLELTHW
jgi:hypothetical protein